MPKVFKVGEAPWEQNKESEPQSFKVGEAPWESKERGILERVGAAVRNFNQGATFGLSDEAMGVGEAIGRVFGVKGAGGPLPNMSLDDPTLDWNELKKAYIEARNADREALKGDMKNSPVESAAAQFIGTLMSPANKIKALKTMSAPKSGLLLGATQGFGSSEADNAYDMAKDTATGAALGYGTGKAVEKIAPIAGKAIDKVNSGLKKTAQFISPTKQKKNADQIIAAADKLGVKVTPGMLDDSGFVERLENELSKSPSFLGQRVKKSQEAVVEKMRENIQGLVDDYYPRSMAELGDEIKSGITAKVAERLDPAAAAFQEVADSTHHIPISQRSVERVIKNIEKIPRYRLTEGAGKAGQYVKMLKNAQNANDMKEIMTMINADLGSGSMEPSEKLVLRAIKEKFSTLEDNSIMRSAIQHAKEGGMRESTGKNIGKDIVGTLKDARKSYRELASDVQSIAKDASIKGVKNPNSFLTALEDIPPDQIKDKLFKANNSRLLKNLQAKFPDEFDLLRRGELAKILEKSIDNTQNGQGKISTQKFVEYLRKMSPEAKNSIFTKDGVGMIENITTLHRSMPRNWNLSNTSSSQEWKQALWANIKDIPTYLLYKGASNNLSNNVRTNLMKIPAALELSKSHPTAFNVLVQRLVAAQSSKKDVSSDQIKSAINNNDYSLKGSQKFLSVGAKNLIDHDSGLSQNEIDKAMKTKRGKALIMQASDLKPDSKAMQRIVNELKGGK